MSMTETGLVADVGRSGTTGTVPRTEELLTVPASEAPIEVLEPDVEEVLPDVLEEGDVWMYTDEAQRELAEAERDVRAGKVTRFADIGDLLADLHA